MKRTKRRAPASCRPKQRERSRWVGYTPHLPGALLGCGDVDDWMDKAMTNEVSLTDAIGRFGPGWWRIIGKIWTAVADHNFEVRHGRAPCPTRITKVYRRQGLLVVRIEPKKSPVFQAVMNLMDIALDHCEECGATDVMWWGLSRHEERIKGRPRILCERCWRSAKGASAWHARNVESDEAAITEAELNVEEWFPGKDERDDVADGEEREDWQK